MPYAIPKNIRYEEKLVGPLTIKQSLYLGVGLAVIAYIYFLTDIDGPIKLMLVVVLGLLTVGVTLFNLDEFIVRYVSFMRTEKKTSWISPAARELMGVKSIRADAVFLKDKRVLGVLRVRPINFGVLSEQDKDTVVYGFLEFLNSLGFSIQICMRSINLDLEDYLRALKRRILQRDDKMALTYYEHFAEYMRSYITVNQINDRHFYIIIPAEKQPTEKKTIENLETRCETIVGTLSLSGIVAERLNTHELINYYASYFTETFEIYESYISPITMYRKMWREAPKKSKPDAGTTEKTIHPPQAITQQTTPKG